MFESGKERRKKRREEFLSRIEGKGPAMFLAAFIAAFVSIIGISKITEGKTVVWEIEDHFADPYK